MEKGEREKGRWTMGCQSLGEKRQEENGRWWKRETWKGKKELEGYPDDWREDGSGASTVTALEGSRPGLTCWTGTATPRFAGAVTSAATAVRRCRTEPLPQQTGRIESKLGCLSDETTPLERRVCGRCPREGRYQTEADGIL